MSDSKMGKAKGWVGRSAGTPHFHASGEREMLSNLPQSRTLLVPQPECSRLQEGSARWNRRPGSALRAHAGEKGAPGHQIKFFFLLIWLSQVLYIIVFMYVSWPCGSLLLRPFPSCGEWALLFVAVHRLLTAVASLVVEHGF